MVGATTRGFTGRFLGGSRLRRALIRRGEGGRDGWGGPLWTQSGGLCGPRSPVWLTTGWVNITERDGYGC